MTEPVLRSREFARRVARTLIPSSRFGVRALVAGVQLISLLPTPVTRTVTRFNDKGVRLYDSMKVPAYPSVNN